MFEKEAEEIFRKNFPQYCSGEELLSPYWDLFESGVNFGYDKAMKENEKSALNNLAEAINTWR